ncbi:protein-glutamate O-methyltransferase CheR [Pseudoalteromonas sp.]|uniref:CheR family methyltransferase n=1 Tax=Pseudoalteromonas sp. TaxID=53249 RepID=UPI0035682CE3
MAKEFQLTDGEFELIAKMVYDACGIVLGNHKREMVYSRLARRIRLLSLSSFAQYIDYLEEHKQQEFSHFINAITTNLTSFFREPYHFDFLRETLIPQILEQNSTTKRVRIWSAGCSTGEEPYSIAMTIADRFPPSWDVKILATDLDSNVLAKASTGEYAENSITGLDESLKKRFFLRNKQTGLFKIRPELKRRIYFKRLNLLQDWPMKGPFDVIFCRNVVIYFDQPTKESLFQRYAEKLCLEGHLFLGHSESMHKSQTQFVALGKTMYRKAF